MATGATVPCLRVQRAESGWRRALEEPDKKSQSAMSLIKNFKLPRGILALAAATAVSVLAAEGDDAQQPGQNETY
ncbi:hypothetical protein K0M31_004733 [Melipona bicolor]|uniref:Uncharacterized protein n=1 Tax=Melipona bicolor TaxID=60889 RepID=A0AA40FVE6_9HYME|nr:hypothetical protein K0M31_004733 [Melipona bicolor]